MLQAVEREFDETTSMFDQPKEIAVSNDAPAARVNPHKYLLYKPTFSQMYAFTASAFQDVAINRVLLLYISADGYDTHLKNKIEQSYDFGGVKTNHRREEDEPESSPILNTHPLGQKPSPKEIHAIFPGRSLSILA